MVVGNSETVKPVSMTMVKKLLSDVFEEFVKEDTSYKMTDPCKRLFAMIFLGNYTEGSLDETIKAITADEKIQRTLKKKLKGKYEKDTETLIKLTGLPEQEASDWAYLTAEIINWEWILQILKAAEWKGTPQEAIEIIRAAVIVDEGIKVTVEAEKGNNRKGEADENNRAIPDQKNICYRQCTWYQGFRKRGRTPCAGRRSDRERLHQEPYISGGLCSDCTSGRAAGENCLSKATEQQA